MIFSQFLRRKSFLFIFALLILIPTILGAIFFISRIEPDKYKNLNLRGYSELRSKIDLLAKDSIPAENSSLERFTNKLTELETGQDLTDEEKYKIVRESSPYLLSLYSSTHNPEFKALFNDLKSFTKENFPDQYKEKSFIIYCQDTSCRDTPEPAEITIVIEEIKNSKVAEYAKTAQIENLKNVVYISKNDLNAKVFSYYAVASIIIIDGEFMKAGINKKIANEIYDYILKTYPDIAKKYEPPEVRLNKLIKQ